MKHSQFAAAITASVAAALLLAGCTAATPTAAPTSANTVAPVVTPTPTPTVAADPSQVRVPFDCDALYTPATAKPLVGTKLTANGGKSAPLTNIEDVAQRQAGVLTCDWSGGIGTDVGPSNFLDIAIAPDAAAGYATNLAVNQPAKNHPVADTAGDKSSYYCHDGGQLYEGYTCVGEMVVGNYWVSIYLIHTVPVKPNVVAAALQSAMEKTATTITAAPPITIPAWPVPAGRATTLCTDGTATMQTALADSTLKPLGNSGGRQITAARAGETDGHYADCVWTSKKQGTLNVDIVNGGSWAFPSIKPMITGDSTLFGTKFVSMTIPGASSALVACKQGECEVFAAVGQAAVQVDFGGSNNAAVLKRIGNVLTAIKAS